MPTYDVHVTALQRPATDLGGAPWEKAKLRDFAFSLGMTGTSKLTPAAVADAMTARAAALPAATAARGVSYPRMKDPWDAWWRDALLHRAHPDDHPAPATGACLHLTLRPHTADAFRPSALDLAENRRFAIDVLRALTPPGPLHAEIARRLEDPRWNQVIPRDLLWACAATHVRAPRFHLHLMVPTAFAAWLTEGEARVVTL
ncbi:MAG: hypothetical protein H6706_29575 [Myxococcales bacterium]|nr:hypothetical protein [Myxococcales bacterium]